MKQQFILMLDEQTYEMIKEKVTPEIAEILTIQKKFHDTQSELEKIGKEIETLLK